MLLILRGVLGTLIDWLRKKQRIAPLKFAVSFIVIVVVCGFLIINIFNNFFFGILSTFNVFPAAKLNMTRTYVSEIQDKLDLISISYRYASSDTRIDLRDGADSCNQWAEYAFVVEVQAGVDLSSLSDDDIRYDEALDADIISVPPPQLMNCNVFDRYSRYRYHEPIVDDFLCMSYEKDYILFAEYQVIESTRNRALNENILEDAEDGIITSLTDLFTAALDRNIKIEFKDTTLAHDASCSPKQPEGWVQNKDDDGTLFWEKQ